MPGNKEPGPSVKDDKLYEDLRDKGYSKEKSARIANAKSNDNINHERGGTKLEDRTKDELYEEAQEIGIEGRSDMNKDELIKAIRNH